MTRATTIVTAAVVLREGRVLLTQRKAGKHLAGAWEFPGGKLEPDEDPKAGLARELLEELGVWVHVGDIFEVTFHRYDSASVLLLFYATRLLAESPEPRALDVAAVRWASLAELDELSFPDADVGVLEKVRRLL